MNCIISFAKKFALPVFIIFALSLTACQVGLGAAVDTQPPVVDIQLPAANSIIRDKFTMSGNWSDDVKLPVLKLNWKIPVQRKLFFLLMFRQLNFQIINGFWKLIPLWKA